MIYGRLCRYAGRDGGVYPSILTLAAELGIGKTQARTYVQELERNSFITVDRENRHFGPNGTGGSNRYFFLWHIAFEGEQGRLRKAPPVRKTGGVPLRKSGPLPLQFSGGEDNHHQESQVKESHVATAKFESATAESQHTPLFAADDDELPPKAPIFRSSWEEIRAQFRMANGDEMAFEDERWLKEQLELRRSTPDALLELVRKNPLNGFKTPMAGLKWLVKKLRAKTQSAAEREAMRVSVYGLTLKTRSAKHVATLGVSSNTYQANARK